MSDGRDQLAEIATDAGLRHIHILAWRDLDDVEAGGSEVHADEIATRWSAAGIDVTMRTSRAQGHWPEGRRHGYRVVRRGGRHLVFADAPLQEALGRLGPRDGLLEIWNGVPFFTPLWARGPRVAFVHHVHADMWRQVLSARLAPVGELVELRIAPLLYRRTRVLTPSESSRADLIERLHLHPSRVSAVPNGVDERYRPGGSKAATPLVLTVGRLVPHKRVDVLIDVAASLRERHPDLRLVIVGDGYERHALGAKIRAADADGWIRLTGRIDDESLLELYRQAWVLTSASTAEGWGMTITEAGACGTPAVVTRIGGHVDAVADGDSGLLVDGTAGLTAGLDRVLSDGDLRAHLARGAIEHAATFTWDRTALGVLQALAEEAARHRRP